MSNQETGSVDRGELGREMKNLQEVLKKAEAQGRLVESVHLALTLANVRFPSMHIETALKYLSQGDRSGNQIPT